MKGRWTKEVGGPGRDRTDDLFHAMEARSQLRHRPIFEDTNFRAWNLYYSRRGFDDSQRASPIYNEDSDRQ